MRSLDHLTRAAAVRPMSACLLVDSNGAASPQFSLLFAAPRHHAFGHKFSFDFGPVNRGL
jgi:hypothetical protein